VSGVRVPPPALQETSGNGRFARCRRSMKNRDRYRMGTDICG
jgi:hypothetical protein